MPLEFHRNDVLWWTASALKLSMQRLLRIHVDADLGIAQHAGEGEAGKLAALVGFDDLRPTEPVTGRAADPQQVTLRRDRQTVLRPRTH